MTEQKIGRLTKDEVKGIVENSMCLSNKMAVLFPVAGYMDEEVDAVLKTIEAGFKLRKIENKIKEEMDWLEKLKAGFAFDSDEYKDFCAQIETYEYVLEMIKEVNDGRSNRL